MTYNAKTQGPRISDNSNYPSDALLTSGMHAFLIEMAAAGLITFTQATTVPSSPTVNDLWYKPDTGLASSVAPAADASVYRWDGMTWQAMTPTQLAKYLTVLAGVSTLPTNAAGFLKNDGAGNLSWDAGNLLKQTLTGQSGNITIDGTYDIIDMTITGNITLNALSNFNAAIDKPVFIRIREDATGGRAISLNTSVFKVGGYTLSFTTTANAINVLGVMVRGGNVAEVIMFNNNVG